MKTDLYIGLMSGTSLDGIDAVLADFVDGQVCIHSTHAHAFPAELHVELLELINHPEATSLNQIGHLDRRLGLLYAEAVMALLHKANLTPGNVEAIGCHGQTVMHQPDANPPFTIQLGDGASIAANCGITTVNDFRRADIALGGQGAPLVPAFHEWVFGAEEAASMVVNIGGIANVTVLRPGEAVKGFDTGPGNTLLDAWCLRHQGTPYDADGTWARSGVCDDRLLKNMLDDPYFIRPAPKSTGREYFHMYWLEQQLNAQQRSITNADVQATLTELTAASIAAAAQLHGIRKLWVCGGGAMNGLLMERISHHLADISVATTAALGLPPEWAEAVAFAWLAQARLKGLPAGLPSVTGAKHPAVLGTVHLPAAL